MFGLGASAPGRTRAAAASRGSCAAARCLSLGYVPKPEHVNLGCADEPPCFRGKCGSLGGTPVLSRRPEAAGWPELRGKPEASFEDRGV